jgi:hypothetical protein
MTPRKPTPGFEKLDRRMAERNLSVRFAKLRDDIESLPLLDRALLVADFVRVGQHKLALFVAQNVVAELAGKVAGDKR